MQQAPYPHEIISYANSLYTTSKITLPLSADEETSRYHLSCFVVIESFKSEYNLPDPFRNKIPINTNKKLNLLLNSFRNTFNSMIESTPRSNRTVDIQMNTPPSSGKYLKSTPSHIDSIRALKYNKIDQVKKSLFKDLKNSINDGITMSPPQTPKNKNRISKDTKLSPYKSRTKIVITTPILVTFCNKFYIPEHLTSNILRTFKLYQHVVMNSWGLLVGLVGITYLQLNRQELSKHLGGKSRLINLLHISQQGGLSNFEVKEYIREVARLISTQSWIKNAKYEDYDDDNDDNDAVNENNTNEKNTNDNNKELYNKIYPSLTCFITPSVQYYSMRKSPQIEQWMKHLREVYKDRDL